MVYRFITQNTFEEKINDMIQSKKDLANLTVGTGESWIGKMSDSELLEVFG
jgi:SNF2 family DNA or RNA helicase